MNLSTFDVFKTLQVPCSDCIELKGDILRRYQNELLHIAEDIVEVCESEHITWHLTGGSALGAVRHHGFIPWDDDLDIDILGEDFDRFAMAFNKRYADKYWLAARETAHRLFPNVPAQDIIECLPFPKIGLIFNHRLEEILKNSDPVDTDDIAQFIPENTADSLFDAGIADTECEYAEQIYALMQISAVMHKPGAKYARGMYYGNDAIEGTAEFKKLEDLSREYAKGKRTYDNGKLFCDMEWNFGKYLKQVIDDENSRAQLLWLYSFFDCLGSGNVFKKLGR